MIFPLRLHTADCLVRARLAARWSKEKRCLSPPPCFLFPSGETQKTEDISRPLCAAGKTILQRVHVYVYVRPMARQIICRFGWSQSPCDLSGRVSRRESRHRK